MVLWNAGDGEGRDPFADATGTFVVHLFDRNEGEKTAKERRQRRDVAEAGDGGMGRRHLSNTLYIMNKLDYTRFYCHCLRLRFVACCLIHLPSHLCNERWLLVPPAPSPQSHSTDCDDLLRTTATRSVGGLVAPPIAHIAHGTYGP